MRIINRLPFSRVRSFRSFNERLLLTYVFFAWKATIFLWLNKKDLTQTLTLIQLKQPTINLFYMYIK